jgi:hypothetical protein
VRLSVSYLPRGKRSTCSEQLNVLVRYTCNRFIDMEEVKLLLSQELICTRGVNEAEATILSPAFGRKAKRFRNAPHVCGASVHLWSFGGPANDRCSSIDFESHSVARLPDAVP